MAEHKGWAMKLLVIGNCQARPMAHILAKGLGATALPPIIVHLAREANAQHDLALMDDADLIFAQFTDANFKPQHVAMRTVKDRHPDKTIVWPNIFYAGQQPWLRYVTHAEKGRVRGDPMGDYHDLRLLDLWFRDRLGRSPVDLGITPQQVHDHSINELRMRERECDIGVTDLIEALRFERRLFFTMNHPTYWLMHEAAGRGAEKLGFRMRTDGTTEQEPLGKIEPPSVLNDLDDPANTHLCESMEPLPKGGPRPVKRYSLEDLKAAVFANYDAQREILQETKRLRYTPRFP